MKQDNSSNGYYKQIQYSQEVQRWNCKKEWHRHSFFNRIESFKIKNKPSCSLKIMQFKINYHCILSVMIILAASVQQRCTRLKNETKSNSSLSFTSWVKDLNVWCFWNVMELAHSPNPIEHPISEQLVQFLVKHSFFNILFLPLY